MVEFSCGVDLGEHGKYSNSVPPGWEDSLSDFGFSPQEHGYILLQFKRHHPQDLQFFHSMEADTPDVSLCTYLADRKNANGAATTGMGTVGSAALIWQGNSRYVVVS